MKQATRLSPALASSLLVIVAVFSLLLLAFSRGTGNPVVQPVATLVSMGLLFFSTHPLGHFLVARAEGVHTEYFFVGRSDFRKLKMKPMSLIGGLVPTIGTKLRKDELSSLSPRKRGYIFGAGVIVSNSLMGIELLYVLLARFGLASIILGALLFVATVTTEAMFSTKVGDLVKMRNEFKKIQ
ncbi:MAG TPA: site-2 protease family protein [Nitrososphaerales archaeon]|nr:site-2 protease family protein [Nitrososphaerales archaeon]